MSYDGDSFTTTTDDVKKHNNRFTLSKFEADLFDENSDIVEPTIRVKRISLPNKGVNWKIYKNDKAVFVLEGIKLTKKEKVFLQSAAGVVLLINEFKSGLKSVHAIKKSIKANLLDA